MRNRGKASPWVCPQMVHHCWQLEVNPTRSSQWAVQGVPQNCPLDKESIYLLASICLWSGAAPWGINSLVPPIVHEWMGDRCPQMSQVTVLEKVRGWCQVAHDTAEVGCCWVIAVQNWLPPKWGVNCRLRGLWYIHLVSIESDTTKRL